ncbi:MAG: hypothetical protein OXS28_09260 [Gammaproteobacteria bacterium]|nr:hypothetical protein [Gammaproteobacteria bacterium]
MHIPCSKVGVLFSGHAVNTSLYALSATVLVADIPENSTPTLPEPET